MRIGKKEIQVSTILAMLLIAVLLSGCLSGDKNSQKKPAIKPATSSLPSPLPTATAFLTSIKNGDKTTAQSFLLGERDRQKFSTFYALTKEGDWNRFKLEIAQSKGKECFMNASLLRNTALTNEIQLRMKFVKDAWKIAL